MRRYCCRSVVLLFLLLGSVCGRAVAAPAADSLDQRLLPCASCHGEQGRATPEGYFPRIAGKPAGYLFEQLLNFRDGRRQHALMTYLVERQSEAYLRTMAEYFAALDLPYAPPLAPAVDADTLARGELLVRKGDAARNIPACIACHGLRMTGVQPNSPGLLGLPRDYLVAQLGAWRGGARHARAPDCMAQVARRLELADIEAVAAWLAAQALPADAHAQTEPVSPPLDCGTLEARP
jgi:cytochrome c553